MIIAAQTLISGFPDRAGGESEGFAALFNGTGQSGPEMSRLSTSIPPFIEVSQDLIVRDDIAQTNGLETFEGQAVHLLSLGNEIRGNRSLPPLQKGGWGGFLGLNAAFIV